MQFCEREGEVFYKVVKGETLNDIARKFNVSCDYILNYNNIDISYFENKAINNDENKYDNFVNNSSENRYSNNPKNENDISAIIESKNETKNNNNELCVKQFFGGEYLFIAGQKIISHIVKPLETLSFIARKYNLEPQKILSFNNTNTIFIGQKLFIPQKYN